MVEVEQELARIFLEDKDVKQVYCVERDKDYVNKDLTSNVIELCGHKYLFTWNYYNGIIICDYALDK